MFSFVDDTVIDPFAGTGTTAVAASRIGRHSINVEIEADYVNIAEERLKNEQGTLSNYESLSVEVNR
jgi:DNA modification methylase